MKWKKDFFCKMPPPPPTPPPPAPKLNTPLTIRPEIKKEEIQEAIRHLNPRSRMYSQWKDWETIPKEEKKESNVIHEPRHTTSHQVVHPQPRLEKKESIVPPSSPLSTSYILLLIVILFVFFIWQHVFVPMSHISQREIVIRL